MKSKRRIWFIMVRHPVKGWTRVGPAYGSLENAKGWVSFVRRAWRGLRTKVSQCTLRYNNGHLDERSIQTLDKKYNMDPAANGEAISLYSAGEKDIPSSEKRVDIGAENGTT